MGIRDFFRKAKILPSAATRQQCLLAGFSFAFHTRFYDYPFDVMRNMDEQNLPPEALAIKSAAHSAGISFHPSPEVVNSTALDTHQKAFEKLLDSIDIKCIWSNESVDSFSKTRLKLKTISPKHEAWFRAGFFLFHTTAQLGFDLIAFSTEEARAVLAREDVKKLTSNLIGAFEDLNWAPNEIEFFCIEKVYPFLWEPALRKWVFDENMAVMSDLRHIARENDAIEEPPGLWERIIPAAKALVEGVPFVGKAASAIFWGEKSK